MSEGDQNDRRGDDRLPEHCRISYRRIRKGAAEEKRQAAETVNLSPSGICLRTDEPLEPGSQLAMEIDLETYPEPVVALGRVIWCEREKERHMIGVCFTWLRDEDRQDLQRISDYLESRSES